MKVKNFTGFLLEYEGGPPVKDPIKIGDRMIDDIETEEEEEEDNENIPILQDLGESLDIDPYEEESWVEPEFSYKKWKKEDMGSIEDYLRQLQNEYIKETLDSITMTECKNYWTLCEDILRELENVMNLPKDELIDIEYDMGDLEKLCYNYEEDEGPDPDLAYDLWVDRNLD